MKEKKLGKEESCKEFQGTSSGNVLIFHEKAREMGKNL
jgi:hypothetical protein